MTDLILDGGVRASIEVIERRSTWTDSCGQGTAAISISRAITAALWAVAARQLHFVRPDGAAEAFGGLGWARPERPVAVPHDSLRVAVRRLGTVPWWMSRLIADSEPRWLAVAPAGLKCVLTRDRRPTREP